MLCLFALVGAGLGACGGAAGEPERPAPSTVATPTEEPSEPEPAPSLPDPPEKPRAMERDDLEGAIAAAEYFLLLYPYVYATGDLDEWEAMSHVECVFCASVSENVEELHERGGYGEGPEMAVTRRDGALPDVEYEYFSVWLDLDAGDVQRFDLNSELIESYPAADVKVDVSLMRPDDEWLVYGLVESAGMTLGTSS